MASTTHTLYIGKRDLDMFMRFAKRYPRPQTSRKILELMKKHMEEID